MSKNLHNLALFDCNNPFTAALLQQYGVKPSIVLEGLLEHVSLLVLKAVQLEDSEALQPEQYTAILLSIKDLMGNSNENQSRPYW